MREIRITRYENHVMSYAGYFHHISEKDFLKIIDLVRDCEHVGSQRETIRKKIDALKEEIKKYEEQIQHLEEV